MTDIRRASNFNSAATISPSYEEGIPDLMHRKDPEAELLQMLSSLPEAGARALLERLRADGRIPAELLKAVEEHLDRRQAQPSEQAAGPVLYSGAASTQRRAEVGQKAMLQQMELQKRFAARPSAPARARQPLPGPGAASTGTFTPGVQQAKATVQSTFAEVQELGRSIAEGKGPASDEEKAAWQASQEKLRQSVTDLAAKVAQLPANSPEREAARAELTELNKQLTAIELPALARMNPEFGESWNTHHSKTPGSDGAALPTRMRIYGITDEQMNEYITTGKESPGLSKAIADAKRTGEWPALGVVRAAFQMRADYLRATSSPDDAASQKQAKDLDAAAVSFTRNRGVIHLNWASNNYAKLANKYPDEAKRPDMVKAAMKEAKQAVASVGKHAAEQVEKHPERYGKNSAIRKLAGDAMTTEANILSTEAKAEMEVKGKELETSTKKQGDAKIVPPPPPLHPDLAEGGTVDKKREAALKIDPSLGDVVNGGDRAVKFARDTIQTKKLRLSLDEQQVAHIQSRQQDPPPQLAAKVNRQLDSIFTTALATHDKLTTRKPGSLSVAQTQLLAETSGDVANFSKRIASAERQKRHVESGFKLAGFSEQALKRGKAGLEENFKAFEQHKIDRIRGELKIQGTTSKKAWDELEELEKNPAKYAESKPDTKEEAELRAVYVEAFKDIEAQATDAKPGMSRAKEAYDYSKKVDELDGLNTDPQMAAGLATDALQRADAHMKGIPEKGPERLPRLKAAMDHQSAVITANQVVRDNADSRISLLKLGHMQVQLAYTGIERPIGEDPVVKSQENLTKYTAEDMKAKRDAFDNARSAAAESATLRESLVKELDAAQAKEPQQLQKQRANDIQAYKDSLAVQQARAQGTVAEMGADMSPKESLAELDKGSQIVKNELPSVHVSRLDKNQAAVEHARNEARMSALASLGESGVAIARRAQTMPGGQYGMLVVDALDRAGSNGVEIHRTLNIDGGGAAEATASKEFLENMKARGDGILNDVNEINKGADVNAFADKLEKELATDVKDFKNAHENLSKKVKDQRSGAFGFFFSIGGRLRGIDINKEALKAGMKPLDEVAEQAERRQMQLHTAAYQLRALKAKGIPDHVIMATLRDPRLDIETGRDTAEQYMKQLGEWKADFDAMNKRYGIDKPSNPTSIFNELRTHTPLGKLLGNANSNGTDRIVDFLGDKHTDLLSKSRSDLQEGFQGTQEQWRKVAPYVALSNAPDQVIMALGSSYAMAGVFARAATMTRIPRVFDAARGLTAGMSAPAKLATLGAVNAAEAGLGIVTGEVISGIGTTVFGKDSFGAKAFDVIGGGFQLSAGSKVALRSGMGFQAAMGLTMHGVPVAAQQLGASPELAAQIGKATGAFMPAVLGTMGNMKTLKRSEGILVNEYGIDPKQAKSLMGDVFRAESHNGGTLDVESFTRERAAKILDAQLPGLGTEARTNLLDTMTLDSIRKKVSFDPPKSATAQQLATEVNNHFAQFESEMIKKGVAPARARQLAEAEKTAMYEEVLTRTNRSIESDGGQRLRGNTPENAVASTRQTVQQVAQNVTDMPEVQVLHTVRDKGVASGQQAEKGYRLVHVDPATDKATVLGPDGNVKEVSARDVVYVHDNQALGVMPPAVKARFEKRLEELPDDKKKIWHDMIGAAHKKSPEHVQLIRQMLAGGSDFERIKQWHEASLNLSQRDLGRFVTPGTLPQHLVSSCAAACAQKIQAILNPEMGAQLRNKEFAAKGQLNKLHEHKGGSEPRDLVDFRYPDRHNPPLKSWEYVPAHPMKEKPPEGLEKALSTEHRGNHDVYDVKALDRRYIPAHLEALAGDVGSVIYGGNGSAYVVEGRQAGASGAELKLRKIGERDGNWVKMDDLEPGQDGTIRLPGGEQLTHFAVPQGEKIKAARNGMMLEKDQEIQDMIHAATGKNIVGRVIQGDRALQAIHDSVNDIGFAGVEIRFPGKTKPDDIYHQILVLGSKEKDGQFVFEVYDPTHGTTKEMSGQDLLAYKDTGVNGELTAVQVPDDLKIQPDNSVTARMQAIPDAADSARMRINPGDRLEMDGALANLELAKTPAQVDAVLAQSLPEFHLADAQTRENMIQLLLANHDPAARKALLNMAPVLTQMPTEVSELVQSHLSKMAPEDLIQASDRLIAARDLNWARLSEEDSLKHARTVFGIAI